jgi:hypothetical protein
MGLPGLIAVSIMVIGGAVPTTEQDARLALLNLNNFVEGIRFSDACMGQTGADALDAFAVRIEIAKTRIIARYPTLEPSRDAGDADWVCDRTAPPERINHRAIRKEVLRLVEDLEGVADR